MSPPTVLDQFDRAAEAHPNRTAIFWDRQRLSYGDLQRRIHVVATNLHHQAAVRPGDRVGILLKNSPEFIDALLAALRMGATVVPINTFLKAPEIQHIAYDCQLKCLITEPAFDEVTAMLQRVNLVYQESLAQRSSTPLLQFPRLSLSDL